MAKNVAAERGAGDPPRPRTRRPRPIDSLQGVGPVEREKMARFCDAMIEGFEYELMQLSQLAAQGREFAGLFQRQQYNRTAIAVFKQLAWTIRTARGGPLHGQVDAGGRISKKKGQQPPTQPG